MGRVPHTTAMGVVLLSMLSNFWGASPAMDDDGPQRTRKSFIVQMRKADMPESFNDHSQWYAASLRSASSSAEMHYIYKEVFHGFAARMTGEEAELLQKKPGVARLYPQKKYKLHTTRTPEFLGLNKYSYLLPKPCKVSNVIIAVLDTGIWPESLSFSDDGLPEVPNNKWRGTCDGGENFASSSCNKKMIGARFFSEGQNETVMRTARDDHGHGTHTASTAAGSVVCHASLFGLAEGNASGMATSARVAAYKVCSEFGCLSDDILAGMDQAVEDGADILSLSLGGGPGVPFQDDPIAIGAFAATLKGVVVSCSAGNDGPLTRTVTNTSPWLITVAAGSLDRRFPTAVSLGNGENFTGESLYNREDLSKPTALVYAGDASKNKTGGMYCLNGTLIPEKVAGKIVICEFSEHGIIQKGEVVKSYGGVGMILVNDKLNGEQLWGALHVLPTAHVSFRAGLEIKSYVKNDCSPTATIGYPQTELGVKPFPVVAAFSSRGPNTGVPKILKPDLFAPGLDILAAWTGAGGSANGAGGKDFNIISGTSMSCPHVSGLAALLKAAHPDWSPAAIKSALMTTSDAKDKSTGGPILDHATQKAATPWAMGNGHVNPIKALSPGLVYDIKNQGYVDFICALNYKEKDLRDIFRINASCAENRAYRVEDLNYPSFAVSFRSSSSKAESFTYTRKVTNVNYKASTYRARVTSPINEVLIRVKPSSLSFCEYYEEKTFTVTISTTKSMPNGTILSGSLEWDNGKYNVRSIIALSWT